MGYMNSRGELDSVGGRVTLEIIIEKSNIVRRHTTVKEKVDPANIKGI